MKRFKNFTKYWLILIIVLTNWLITCIGVYIICRCFDLVYTWKIGTGIFFVVALIKNDFIRINYDVRW